MEIQDYILCKKMSYYEREHIICSNKYKNEGDILKLLDFLIEIFVEFG